MSKANLYNSSGFAVVPKLFKDEGNCNIKKNLEKVEENIRIELMTSRGTQPGDPNMGSDIYKLLYRGNNSATATMIRYEIDRVFEEKFPELSIERIDVDFIQEIALLHIYYKIQYSNVSSNMTLEFIRDEGGYVIG